MSVSPTKPTSRGLPILKTILYILAGLVLVVGLIAGISLVTSATYFAANLLLPLQLLGLGETSGLIAPMLSGFFINLGVFTLILTFVLSALLYGLGRLFGHITSLERRLASLEARL
jgi:hypothetical protein